MALQCNGFTVKGHRCIRKVYPCQKNAHVSEEDIYCFQHSKFDNAQDCPICFEALLTSQSRRHVIKTKCNHTFHKRCLNKWLATNNSCPICRTQLKEQPVMPESSHTIEDDINMLHMARFHAIMIQLIHENHQRIQEQERRERERQIVVRPSRSFFARLFCM